MRHSLTASVRLLPLACCLLWLSILWSNIDAEKVTLTVPARSTSHICAERPTLRISYNAIVQGGGVLYGVYVLPKSDIDNILPNILWYAPRTNRMRVDMLNSCIPPNNGTLTHCPIGLTRPQRTAVSSIPFCIMADNRRGNSSVTMDLQYVMNDELTNELVSDSETAPNPNSPPPPANNEVIVQAAKGGGGRSVRGSARTYSSSGGGHGSKSSASSQLTNALWSNLTFSTLFSLSLACAMLLLL